MICSHENSGNRQDRGLCHEVEAKEREKNFLSRGKIYSLRGTDAQKFLLTALFPTYLNVVSLEVTLG